MQRETYLRDWLRAFLQLNTLLGLALIGLAWAATLAHLNTEERTIFQVTQQNTDNLARLFEEQIVHAVDGTDKILLSLRTLYAKSPEQFDIEDARVYLGETIKQFTVIDPAGILKSSTRMIPQGLRLDLSDREHFRAQLNTEKDELFISQPVVGRRSNTVFVWLTRRLSNPDGSFGGVIEAAIEPDSLERFYNSIDVGREGIIAVIGLDSFIRASRGFKHVTPGLSLAGTPLFRRLQESPAGFFVTEGQVDGVRRLVSYRKLDALPLIVTVGLAQHEVFAAYWHERTQYYIAATLLTIIVLTGIGLGSWRKRKLIKTAKKMEQAQEALARSEERYKLVEEAVNDVIFDHNLQTHEVYLSPHWKGFLGYANDEISSNEAAFLDLIHPDDKAAFADVRRGYLEGKEPKSYVLDFRLRHKNGDYRWMHSRGKVLFDAMNRPARVLGSITDITEQKKAEEELLRSEERYRLVDSAVNDGLWDWDILTGYEYIAPRWKAILGYEDEEVPNLKSAFYDLLHPEDKAAVIEATRAHLEERRPYSMDYRLRCKNGGYRWVHTRGTALFDAEKRPVRMIGAITDITERKQSEAIMARMNQDLEARVSERTAELTQEMRRREEAQMTLAQMQKMEAVGQLTAGIAHDFNNLLAVIRGSLEFAESAAVRGLPADPDLLDAATRATRRGSELVRRLLAFSRQSPLRAEPMMLDQMVLDTLRMLQRTLGENIDIVTHLDATAAAVCVDCSMLANVLVNLALNARDAMPEGGELTIATTCQASPWAAKEGRTRWPTGEAVCITVRDTGVGMTEEVRKRAFEPFFTTKKDGLGSGLGLSMVQGFVEQSGGHIEVESEAGHGTSIMLHLPRIDMTSQSADSEAVAGSFATGNEKTVLLVEDDPDVRVVITAQLKKLGYKVHAVTNGNEAIDLIESPAHIDITLTDIVLPGGTDGVTLIKNAMLARPKMGVLCMSGYDATQKNRKWFQAQNIAFLAKPFTSTRLAQALDEVLAA